MFKTKFSKTKKKDYFKMTITKENGEVFEVEGEKSEFRFHMQTVDNNI